MLKIKMNYILESFHISLSLVCINKEKFFLGLHFIRKTIVGVLESEELKKSQLK